MGNFYGGNEFKNYVNAKIKFGTNQDATPCRRMGSLRKEHTNFEMNYYLELPNDTKAIREAIEHHVKMMMERHYPELTQIGNDHFGFKTNKDEHKTRVDFYLREGFRFAIEYCDMFGIEHGRIIMPNYRKAGVHYKTRSKKTRAQIIQDNNKLADLALSLIEA